MPVFSTGQYRVATNSLDGTPASQVLGLPDGVVDIQIITEATGISGGSVQMTYSPPAAVAADTADWIALPQTHTVIDGRVVTPLMMSTPPAPISPTAIKFSRSGGTLVGYIVGKRVR